MSNDKDKSDEKDLFCWHDLDSEKSPKALIESLQAQQNGVAPELFWIEPLPAIPKTPQLGPLSDFQGLNSGWPTFDRYEAEEIRLYWPKAMMQIIVQDKGCRWFACSEGGGTPPFEQFVSNGPKKSNESVSVTVTEYDVYLRRDSARFNIRAPDREKVKVVEYRSQGCLFAWRLMPV